MTPPPVIPKPVYELSSWQGLPWRLRGMASRRPWTVGGGLALVWLAMLMTGRMATPMAGAVMAVMTLPLWLTVCMGMSMLTNPKPLDATQMEEIFQWVSRYPHFEDQVAAWLAAGELDSRHYWSLLNASVDQRRQDELQRLADNKDQMADRLRAVNSGSLGSKVDQIVLGKATTPPAKAGTKPVSRL